MSLSESFDPESLSEYLTPPKSWFSGESTPSVPQGNDAEVTESSVPYLHWQEHLLPLSCVSQEDSLTVLRLELETAHQLLQYQQTAIDALSEQLTNRDLALQHKRDELSKAQQISHQQASQISELGAICRDLKMQLRRQQQRVLQYRDLLKTESVMDAAPAPTASSMFTESVVSFGYGSISVEACSRSAAVPKPVPVSAWSAPESIDLTGPLACYRELATIRMTTARIRLESARSSTLAEPAPVLPSISASICPEVQGSEDTSVVRVELPSFTRSSG